MQWAEPAWLALLILMPLPWLRERARPRLGWPTVSGFDGAKRSVFGLLAGLPNLCLALAIGSTAVALARPRTVGGTTRIASKGAAIVVAIDRSPSMNAADLSGGSTRITRIDAAKRTLVRFIEGRPDDLIGIVAFANMPDLTCPPTLDHDFARRAAAALSVGIDEGTNLGDALAWSLDALRKASATSRVLILLSDGRNQPDLSRVKTPLDPKVAARFCRELGVTLHTIAVGDAGGLIRTPDPATRFDVLDEVGGPDLALLAELARIGGGRAFRATDAKGLADVFAAIDALEKSPVSDTILTRYDERFAPWAFAAFIGLAFNRLLRGGRWARLP